MADATAGRDPVERLLDEFLASRRRGQTLDIDVHAARAGERAAELRELIDSAVLLEDMKGARPRGLPLVGPQVFGDYRIVAEIGRGGMGVVYEAEQMTLQRRVALKVLPPQALRSEQRLARFKREAQTAAKLHHTNIVPIFGVGEQDGVHYFVMQLIVGRPLDDVIRALRGDAPGERPPSRVRTGTLVLSASSAAEALRAGTFTPRPPSGEVGPGDAAYYRSVASLGLQVADALTYAHLQGTLHRDIKPANLILDAHGVLWVTDFGLAKVMEDEAFTGSGDVVGTLQYMAPEQFGGQADERTDVHGLGLTLYELATLRPAFAADSKGELLDRVKNQEAMPASRVRPGVPRDLDTIIRKAIAKDPKDRYATAADLRDDLERFLQDRPIRARPVSVVESGWRWCRRNRLLASVGAVAAFGLVSTAIASAVGYWSTRRALDRAVAATALAEANVAVALQGFEDLFGSIVGPELLRADDEDEGDVVALEATRRISEDAERMLEKMLGTYDRLAAANSDNAAARQLTARAYHRVGEIHRQLRKLDAAVANYERAVALYRQLAASGDVTPGVWMQVQNGLCRALWDTVFLQDRRPDRVAGDRVAGDRAPGDRAPGDRAPGDRAAAEGDPDRDRRAIAQRALALGEEIIAYDPAATAPLVRFERARAQDLLGVNLGYERFLGRGGRGGRRGREERPSAANEGTRPVASAAEHHRQALALNESLLQQEPTNVVYRQATARSCYLLAAALRRTARSDAERKECEDLQQRAVAALEALIAQEPRAAFRVDLIQALSRGPFRGRGEDDLRALQRTAELWEGLVRDFPNNTRYLLSAQRSAQSLALALSADAARSQGESAATKAAQAREARQRALALAEKLAAARPDEPVHAMTVAEARGRLAMDLLSTDPAAAFTVYRQVKESVDAAATTEVGARTALRVRLMAAQLLEASGRRAEARAELAEAIARVGSLEESTSRQVRFFNEQIVGAMAELCERFGDTAQAEALRKRLPQDGSRGRRDARDG